jgi:ComF family protein
LEDNKQDACLSCQIEPPVLDNAICALHYSSPVDYLIKRMKFGHQLSHSKVLGSVLAQHLSQFDLKSVDAILPVPLHKARLRSRGFNQSLELAHALRRYNNIPLLQGVQRTVNTKAQTLVKGEDREANIRDAFNLDVKVALPNHVAIIDDVITTGSTCMELARLLKASGVSEVSVWAVARATTH